MTGNGEVTGRHVLLAFLGFFGAVFAANGAFVYFATSSWTGLETKNAYVRGIAYNRVLEAANVQRDLGWDVGLEITGAGPRSVTMTATFTNADGRPLDDLSVAVELRRPATEGHDQTVVLEAITPGAYGAHVDLPLAGNWDARMAARDNQTEVYVVERRVWVR